MIKDIKQILEPSARFIFIQSSELPRAYALAGVVGKNVLVVTLEPHDTLLDGALEGFFAAANGGGIVRFQAQATKEKTATGFLGKIEIDMESLRIQNRRESLRHSFDSPVPVLLYEEDGIIDARIINMSEGGMRLSVARRLATQVICQFQLKLPTSEGVFEFVTDGLVVYSEPEEKHDRFMTGVSFVEPTLNTAEQKNAYRMRLTQLKIYLTNLLN